MGYLDEEAITKGMAEIVVDVLEAIQVDEEEHQGTLFPGGEPLCEALTELQPIAQACEGIAEDRFFKPPVGHMPKPLSRVCAKGEQQEGHGEHGATERRIVNAEQAGHDDGKEGKRGYTQPLRGSCSS